MRAVTSGGECGECGTAVGGRAAFQFQTLEGTIVKCAGCAVRHPPMLRRSLMIALIVGTILVAINQGDVLLRAEWPRALWWKVPMTYLVPLVVATWGALVNSRLHR